MTPEQAFLVVRQLRKEMQSAMERGSATAISRAGATKQRMAALDALCVLAFNAPADDEAAAQRAIESYYGAPSSI